VGRQPMSAIADLTEEECYLAAILDDASGVELAEFTWIDEESEDGCFRLWDFQWVWYRCDDTFQIDHCGRAVGKSIGIQMRAFAFPFHYPGAEMLITAPELNHLKPVTDRVEHLFRSTRLGQCMLPTTRGNGINHQPQFQAHFKNNSRIISRLPNRDGRGVKGMHPLVIEMDEGQDYPNNGWTELIETMKAGSKGAQWRIHGVSRGVRDRYYTFTQNEDPNMPFTVHRFMAMHRPSWGPTERRSKIAMYGGTEDNVDYRRNIYGEHGDATNPVFVLARLMACVRIQESTWATTYNDQIYSQVKVNDELLRSSGAPIDAFIQLPATHLSEDYSSYWAGMDVGYTRDPSEIIVVGVTKHPTQKHADLLRILARVHLMRISADDQAEAVRFLFGFYGERLKCLALDKTGNGLPLWQMLDPEAVGTNVAQRRTPAHISQRIRGYNFSSKVAVEFDDRELKGKETQLDAVIERNIVDFATDELRKLIDANHLELPFDQELLTEWQGQEIQYVRDEGSAAGLKSRRYGGGSFHTLDAAKMLVAGRSLQSIEAAMNMKRIVTPRLARFGGM
jgi:hypothetical protein